MINDSCLRGHHSLGGWREIPPLSQPIIPALNISRENNVKFRLKEQSIHEAEKLHRKKHGTHMKTTRAELTSSRTQMQRGTPVIHSNWLLPSESHTRRKTPRYTLRSLVLCSFRRCSQENTVSLLPNSRMSRKNILPVENGFHAKDVFLSSAHVVLVFGCSFSLPPKSVFAVHVIQKSTGILLPEFTSRLCCC